MNKKIIKTIMLLVFVISFNNLYANDRDPWQNFNRSIFKLNTGIDSIFVPIARSYKDNVHQGVQIGASNFFANITDINTAFNQLLQGKIPASADSFFRIIINTTFGILGVIEAQERPIQKEDLGQTFATWGIGSGPYLVLPLIGPSTVRDGIGLISDINLVNNITIEKIDSNNTKTVLYIIGAIDKRAQLLSLTNVLNKTDDPYITYREAYLQKRKYDIADGKVSNIVKEF